MIHSDISLVYIMANILMQTFDYTKLVDGGENGGGCVYVGWAAGARGVWECKNV